MIKLKKILDEISTNASSYVADAGEPDTGFTKKGKKRTLGVDKSKPEPWFNKGGYKQVDFPVADNPYDASSGKGDDKNIQRVQVIKRIINTGVKYDGYQSDVGSWDKYGDKDYSTDFTVEDFDKILKAEQL